MQPPRPCGLITLLSDFGAKDPYVGIVKGMVKCSFGRAEIIDLCHEVPSFDIAAGAFLLASAVGRFPDGTVHLGIVDPGVGTERRVLAVCAESCYWIGPDNGLLGAVLRAARTAEVRQVDLEALGIRPSSHTFHGRDVFAPLGAMLAEGRYGFRALGPRLDDPAQGPALESAGARVILVDRFGNLITGISARQVRDRSIGAVRVRGRSIPVVRVYGEVDAGQPLALINSFDLLEIAVNQANASELLGVGVGEKVVVGEAAEGAS